MLASGSGGNAVLVRAGELCMLVDAGLPIDELEKRLAAVRVPLHRLDAIALTHGHLDHARASGLLSKKSGARLYCSQSVMSNASVRGARAMHVLPGRGTVSVRARQGRDELLLTSIPLPHDAEPTFAFRLEHGGRRAAVCTDMGEFERGAAAGLADVEVLVLEFNHDPELLAKGPYSPALKRRVGGPRGHLSNAQAAEVLRACAGASLHTLILAHLSRTNNRPEMALASARSVLGELGLGEVLVLVAEQDGPGPSLEV